MNPTTKCTKEKGDEDGYIDEDDWFSNEDLYEYDDEDLSHHTKPLKKRMLEWFT